MKGNEIIVTANPQGVFLEGIISGTPKPGTIMELTSAALQGGRPTYQAWSKATGAYGAIFVLLPDHLQGKIHSDAYVSGTRGFLYAPQAGDDLNLLVADVAGTADDVAIGALMGVETVTGKLKANSSYAKPGFTARETITDPAADYWLWSTFNG